MLFKGQGDIEPQAVLQARAFVGCGHDAATATGDDHQVGTCQRRTHLSGQRIQRAFHWRTRRAEYRDFAPALELFEHPKGMVQFTDGTQGDLGVPAITVVLGHAQDGEDHVSIKRDIRAVGGDQLNLCVDLLSEVGPVFFKMTKQQIIRFIRHSISPSLQGLGSRRERRLGHDTACVAACRRRAGLFCPENMTEQH